ncbi:MAG: phage portal protein, partial [Planctomycetota bacterium]
MTTANENAPQLSSEYVVGVFEARRDPQIEILSLGRPQHIRGWEAAKTHRLNREAWREADGAPLNEDIDEDLETVRNRAAYEAKNNGMVEGVIWSCQRGVVGANGPILRVLSESEEYNRAAERIWRQWAKQPTPRPGVSLASVLRLWVRRLWDCGEFFAQKITGPGPISLRLKGIHPRRVASPFDQAGREDVVLGVRVDRNVVPQQYFVADQRLLLGGAPTRYEPVPADLMIHGFLLEEEDQLRGVPWFASCLGAINDVRSFDNEVLEAARNAAKASIFLYTQSTDAGFFPMSGTTTLRSGTINTAPPGYQVAQLTPTQPGAQYHQYRPERHREIGRVRGMSLMEIRQDASGHNYSSARFDGQSDALSYRVIQAWLAGEHLDPLVDEVLREAELARLTPRRPDDVVYQWIWPGRPHVDPTKERTADRMALEDGTMSYTQLLADHGHDPDRVIEQRRLDNERLVAAGLAPIRTIWETGGGNTAERAAASDLEETVQDAVEEIRALGEQLTTRDDPQRDLCTRTLNVRAATINEDERSVEAVVATEQRSVVYDWNRGTIEEVLIAGGAEYGAQVPLLDNHYRYSLEAVLGSVRQIRVSGDQVSGRLYFARGHEAAETAWNLVRQGHLTDVSVGYRPIDGGYVDIEPGQTAVVAGRSYTAGSRVLRITQRWVVKEVSIVPIGADSAAKIREDRATLSRQEQPMLRQYLISLGMRADASDAEMQAFITTLQGSQRAEADRLAAAGHATPPAQPQPEGQRSEPPAAPPANPPSNPPAQRSEATPPAQESPAELARRAIADERNRVRSLRELARDDVPQELVNRAIDEGWDDNRASREFLTAVRERRAPPVSGQAPAGHVRDHASDCNTRSLAAGLLIACGGDP